MRRAELDKVEGQVADGIAAAWSARAPRFRVDMPDGRLLNVEDVVRHLRRSFPGWAFREVAGPRGYFTFADFVRDGVCLEVTLDV